MYSITAAFSILAYLWLLVIVDDEVVQIWEGVVSFLFFPFLVALAYMADIGLFSANRRRVEPEPQIQSVRAPGFSGEYKVALLCCCQKSFMAKETKLLSSKNLSALTVLIVSLMFVAGTPSSRASQREKYRYERRP